jgi:hypothetical protein
MSQRDRIAAFPHLAPLCTSYRPCTARMDPLEYASLKRSITRWLAKPGAEARLGRP